MIGYIFLSLWILGIIGMIFGKSKKNDDSKSENNPKEKALKIINNEGVGKNLVNLYTAVEHYPSWSKRDDFDARWNIGADNIKAGEEKFEFDSEQIIVKFIKFSLLNANVKLTYWTKSYSLPDGWLNSLYIKFDYQDKLVMIARCFENSNQYTISYVFSDVEEFHYNKDAIKFLKKIDKLIEETNKRRAMIDEQDRIKKMKGKFTL